MIVAARASIICGRFVILAFAFVVALQYRMRDPEV